MDYLEIKRKLETHQCRTHGKTPTVKVEGDTFKLSCCCDEFKNQLIELTKEYGAEQAIRDIEDKLRGIFT